MTTEREGLAEAQLPLAQAVWEGFKSSPFIDITYRDAEGIAATVLASDALADLLAARDRRVRAEAWDEGVTCAGRYGHEDTWEWPDDTPYRWNPYREEADA